ncbi:MAG: T9SS type A sorting domain-containing protein [Bacteroidia bacterium]|nr:T9SS type A sorting domain-containing protein [Bacteroidia bacterium]
MKRKIFIILFLFFFYYKGFTQAFSPFVHKYNATSDWNAISLFNDTIYFNIGTFSFDDGFGYMIVKVSKDLKYGSMVQNLNGSIYGNMRVLNNRLIGSSTVSDYKNTYNSQVTIFDGTNRQTGPLILGDTSNTLEDINTLNQDILVCGSYTGRPFPGYVWRESGFLARYSLAGIKKWERYYRREWNGFKSAVFDYVYHTRNNQILVIGRSHFENTASQYQKRVITAILDTSGNLLEANSEMDTFGLQYDPVKRANVLPDISYAGSTQLNDSTYCVLLYNGIASLTLDPTWVFFNDEGKIVKTRKAWMFRDTVNNPLVFNATFKGLVKSQTRNEFLAHCFFDDSIDRQRMLVLDNDLYIKKVYPGLPTYDTKNSHAGLMAFVQDEDKNFYQLRFLDIDSISSTSTYGSLVCKLDSNGKLLSNGPLFPVGMQDARSLSGLLLYPNPSANSVTINYEGKGELNLEVYSVVGKLIDQTSFSETLSYDLSNKPKGIYWFKCTGKNGASETKKVVHY